MHVIIINHHVRMLKLKHNAHPHLTKNQQSKVRSPHRVQSLNSSRPQQSLFRPAPTTRRPRYGRHGGGNRLAGFPRTPSHRSGPFRAQLKARAALLQRPPALLRRLEPLLPRPPAAAASHACAWCTCTGPLPRWLEHASHMRTCTGPGPFQSSF